MAGHGDYNAGFGGGAKDIRNMDNLVKALNDINLDSLKIDGTTVTATAAELNIMSGVTAVAAELNYLDISSLGTGAASKAVVLDSGDDYTWPSAGVLTYGGTAITASGKEINELDSSVSATILEDFMGVWVLSEEEPVRNWLTGIGNGTTPVVATTVANSLVGEVTMKSATSAGAGTAVNSMFTGANLGWKADQGGLSMEVRLKIDDIVEAYIFVGFTDAIASTKNDPISFTDGSDTPISAAANACGLVFTGDSTTQKFHSGGVKATADTAANFSGTAPVNNTYITLRVDVSATGVLAAYINGTAETTVAAAITAGTAITPCIVVGNTASAQTIMTVDYIKVSMNR